MVTKVAGFQSEKARTSTWTTQSPVVLSFLLTSLLQNPYADTNNFYIVRSENVKNVSHSEQFSPFFLCFGLSSLIIVSNLALRVRLKFPDMSRHSGRWFKTRTHSLDLSDILDGCSGCYLCNHCVIFNFLNMKIQQEGWK